MRIAFICTSGLDNATPRGRLRPLARELVRLGYQPFLFLLHPTFDRLKADGRNFIVDGMHIVYAAQMHVYGLPGERRYFNPLKLAGVSLRATYMLTRACLRSRPDIVHVCKPQPINGLAGWLAARRLRCPLFVDCDDYEAEANRTSSALQRRIIAWWEDRLPRHAQGVTVNTRFLQARCIRQGVPPGHIAYVPNGADPVSSKDMDAMIAALPAEVQALRNFPTVAYVGTMSTIAHGVDLLLNAFAMLRERLPHARLLMVGDGDDRAALQAQAEALGIASSVHWTGRLTHLQARAHYGVAACSVDPVYDTPAARARSPLKIVESLAAGVPVVTGDVGDRREMLASGAAGVLVSPGDAQALAEGILTVLCNEALRLQLRAGALCRREHYRWDTLAAQWAGLYSCVTG